MYGFILYHIPEFTKSRIWSQQNKYFDVQYKREWVHDMVSVLYIPSHSATVVVQNTVSTLIITIAT